MYMAVNPHSLKTTALAAALAALLSLGSSGCSNIEDDATRTKTEGTLAGAGIGTAIGAGIGAIFGDSKGALIGAGIGAAIGSISGYFVGKHVADRKAEYASREDWLDACIERSKTVTAETRKYNEELKKDVATLDKETKRLAANKKNVSRDDLAAEGKKIATLREATEENIKELSTEVSKQKEVLADARQNGNKQEAQALNAEIKQLESQIKTMKEYNRKLASISARVAV